MRRVILLAVVCVVGLHAWADTKPKPVPLLRKENQAISIEGLNVSPVAQKCENFGWAVSVETLLRLQRVALDQKFWVTKLNSGEVCMTDMASFEDMAGAVDGEYILGVTQKVRLKTKYARGAPTVPDDIILSLRDGMPMIIFWKQHPYLLVGVGYDEYVGPNNARIFHIKELKLLDPMVAADDPQRTVSFVRERDNISDIDGTMTVLAVPVE